MFVHYEKELCFGCIRHDEIAQGWLKEKIRKQEILEEEVFKNEAQAVKLQSQDFSNNIDNVSDMKTSVEIMEKESQTQLNQNQSQNKNIGGNSTNSHIRNSISNDENELSVSNNNREDVFMPNDGYRRISCPKCGTLTLRGIFSTWQIVVSVIFFPLGLLSLLAGRELNECPKCGYIWKE